MSKLAILLVDHGSVREEANEMLHDIAQLLRPLAPEYHIAIAHMELAEPTIARGMANCVEAGAEKIIVHPYMLAPGRHSTSDIPRMVNEVAAGFPGLQVEVTSPLGVDEQLARVILKRVEETRAASSKQATSQVDSDSARGEQP